MMKNKKRNQVVGPIVIVGIFLAIGLATLLLSNNPEYRRVVASDGGLTVAGDFPLGVDVTVQIDGGASMSQFTSAVEKIYMITPDGITLPTDVSVHMPTRQRGDELYRIGYFDLARSFWVPVETVRDDVLGYFEAKTNHFSNWTLLAIPKVIVGDVDRSALISDVMLSMPVGTQSYNIDLAYSTVDGDYVLLQKSAVSGRCEDSSTLRGTSVQTSIDRPAVLLIDGESVVGQIRAVALWTVGTACTKFVESSTGQ